MRVLLDQPAASKQNLYGYVISVYSLKRLLICHMIKLVKMGDDLKPLALVTIAGLPFTTETNKGVILFFFFSSCSLFSVAKTPKQSNWKKFDWIVSMSSNIFIKNGITVCIAYKTFLNIDVEGCLHFLIYSNPGQGESEDLKE